MCYFLIFTPLSQACSLCPIQNSLPILLVPPVPLVSPVPALSAFPFLPPVESFPHVPPVSLVPPVPLVPPNSKFKIQNSKFKIPSHTTTAAKIIFLVILSRYCTSTATEKFSKYTYPIQTIQEHRRISEPLPKYKQLTILPQPENFSCSLFFYNARVY